MLDDLVRRAGATLGAMDRQLRNLGGSGPDDGREVAVYDTDTGEVHDLDAPDVGSSVVGLTIAGWALSRLLRPRPVSWPRVILAGFAATALADLVGRAIGERHEPGEEPYAEGPEKILARIGAGVAIAAGYAAILYPRLPGPPLARGLAFGALEVAAAPRGGLVRLAEAAPGVKFPLQALASPVDEDAGPLSHMAFGLGLGLFYRFDGSEAEEPEDE